MQIPWKAHEENYGNKGGEERGARQVLEAFTKNNVSGFAFTKIFLL